MNKPQIFSRKNILLFIAVITLAIITTLIWLKHKESENLKLSLERERIGNALRQAGIASAKIQLSSKPSLTEDAIAPHELTGEGELAQAKLWLSLPKEKRSIMQVETTKAGLATKSSNN